MPQVPIRQPAQRRRLILRGLARAGASTALLIVLYFVVPLDLMRALPVGVTLTIALIVLLGVTIWQVSRIIHAAHPRIRAVEALAITAPLYVLLFASAYFVMASSDPAAFTAHPLTRIDTLYFTVTIFTTVGFGDISPAGQGARLLVMIQMILNLIVLGAGIQVFVGAAKRGSAA